MPYFNEIYSKDGQVRPHYANIIEHWKSISTREKNILRIRSKKLFSGDYKQDPLPRILTHDEFQYISYGVRQRGRAIMAFLRDYCTKGTNWSQVMPNSILNMIIERHHDENILKTTHPDRLAFPYGPDIIRDSFGRWRVVEDSAGIVGGIGDLVQSQKILYRQVPAFRKIFSNVSGGTNDPLEFFASLAKYFSKKAEQNNGIPLLYMRPYGVESDQETSRLAQAFAKYGIASTTSSNNYRKLEIKNDKDTGIYLRTNRTNQRVGALILHAGPDQFQGRILRLKFARLRRCNKSNATILMDEVIRELSAPSLKTALVDGHAWTNFSPGVQFINDKLFGLYVDKMICHFLKETPLLSNIPAKPVAICDRKGVWKLDSGIVRDLRRNKENYVVKRVDQDCGTGVWIGQKETKKSLEKLIENLRHEPTKFIIQEFEHLSVLDNKIVDLRLHAHVDSEQIIVSNTPWGRAKGIRGNGKVNIGSNGITSPVVVMRK